MTNGIIMVTDCICVCLYVFFCVHIFCRCGWEGWGGERQTTEASVAGIWLEEDDSQSPHLFSLGTLGTSLLNATCTIHLFNVGWQMRDI